MKLLFILLSFLTMIFGIILLIFALAAPDWYKKHWAKLIEGHTFQNHTPPKLIENTIIVGAITLILGLVSLIVILELYPKGHKKSRRKPSKKSRSLKKSPRKPSKKSRSPKTIFLRRRINKGAAGGKYYLSKKCIRSAKGKVTCKMKKNYIK